MSYTQPQLDELEKAIAQGVLRVRYTDKEVIYRSLEEMQRIRLMMRKELGLPQAPTHVVAKFSKGLR